MGVGPKADPSQPLEPRRGGRAAVDLPALGRRARGRAMDEVAVAADDIDLYRDKLLHLVGRWIPG
eukprot:SAG11_NODE_1856_length_4162_cov_4.778981_1_plen_65_part_00